MSLPNLLGTIGVALLLLAFLLNLSGYLMNDSWRYQLLNAAGAGISCYASWLIGFFPFVVLEAIWGIVAIAAMTRSLKSH
ncbi:MAG: CBU_0592 family membrane protein [Candidatus Binataceae bacterium]